MCPFVERDEHGRYPDILAKPSPRPALEDAWRRLCACELRRDPIALERARLDAHAALDRSITRAMNRGGLELVGEGIRDVDMRGW